MRSNMATKAKPAIRGVPEKRKIDRAEVCAALGIYPAARIEFGGREWCQDFDEISFLIVTTPSSSSGPAGPAPPSSSGPRRKRRSGR